MQITPTGETLGARIEGIANAFGKAGLSSQS